MQYGIAGRKRKLKIHTLVEKLYDHEKNLLLLVFVIVIMTLTNSCEKDEVLREERSLGDL
jgi:hypothetical protein